MTDERFYKALLAALRQVGIQFVDTRGTHHRALEAALQLLEELKAEGLPGADAFPSDLFPAPITGAYDDFEEALLNFQDLGLSTALNPFYDNIELSINEQQAEALLNRYSPDERGVLLRLAAAFAEFIPQAAQEELA